MAKGDVAATRGTKAPQIWIMVLPRRPNTRVKDFKAMVKQAIPEMAKMWDEQFKKKHFEAGAAAEYKYQRRSPITQRVKEEAGVGQQENVKYGHLMAAMMGQHPEPKESSSKITMLYEGLPKYTRLWGGKGRGGARKYLELTRVSQKECEAMAQKMTDIIDTQIAEQRGMWWMAPKGSAINP